MNKIATPQELKAELQRLIAACEGSEKPSREKLAEALRDLSNRVVTAADDRKVYVQKRDESLEFSGYDREADKADFSKDLGTLAIRERPLKDLIKNLENVLAKLKKHEGDVFVVQ